MSIKAHYFKPRGGVLYPEINCLDFQPEENFSKLCQKSNLCENAHRMKWEVCTRGRYCFRSRKAGCTGVLEGAKNSGPKKD